MGTVRPARCKRVLVSAPCGEFLSLKDPRKGRDRGDAACDQSCDTCFETSPTTEREGLSGADVRRPPNAGGLDGLHQFCYNKQMGGVTVTR